jgi:hypothetical protein
MSPAPTPSSAAILARARRATRLQFGVLGTLAGAWGAHIPSVKQHFRWTKANWRWCCWPPALAPSGRCWWPGRVVARLVRGARPAAPAC